MPAQGGDQSQVIDHRRPQRQRQAANLLHDPVDLADGLLPEGRGLVRGQVLAGVQGDLHSGQGLADLVVQFLGKVAPLGFLGLQELARQGREGLLGLLVGRHVLCDAHEPPLALPIHELPEGHFQQDRSAAAVQPGDLEALPGRLTPAGGAVAGQGIAEARRIGSGMSMVRLWPRMAGRG